ncbi:MAG: hypothetical protein OCU12_07780 [Methanophagales archaeon]|nr:hypothetical protein [Methanophagales archaeon]
MKNSFRSLWRSRKFLIALLAVIQTVLFQFVPDFPESVWLSIDGLAAVVIAGIALEDAGEKLGSSIEPVGRERGIDG